MADLKILHIACVTNSPFNGVCVVAPLHAKHQGEYASTAFLNINGTTIDSACNQINLPGEFSLDAVKEAWHTPDLVIFHEAYRMPYLKIAAELKRHNVPYVIIPHGELSESAQKKKYLKKKIANLVFFNRFVGGALAVQCLSDFECSSVRFKARKIVETNGIAIPNQKKADFSSEGVGFLYIGRLDAYHKGLDLMIEAIALAASELRRRHASFRIFGPDYQGRFDNIQALIKEHGVEDLVRFDHELTGKEKEGMLLASDIFLQTSRFEGMPMGILEALSYGLPVAVTQGTTIAPFVAENASGWTSSTDSSDIARMLVEASAADREELALKSCSARNSVANAFAWDRVAEQAVSRYQALLAELE